MQVRILLLDLRRSLNLNPRSLLSHGSMLSDAIARLGRMARKLLSRGLVGRRRTLDLLLLLDQLSLGHRVARLSARSMRMKPMIVRVGRFARVLAALRRVRARVTAAVRPPRDRPDHGDDGNDDEQFDERERRADPPL